MLLNNEFEINDTLTLVELSVMENDRISAQLQINDFMILILIVGEI